MIGTNENGSPNASPPQTPSTTKCEKKAVVKDIESARRVALRAAANPDRSVVNRLDAEIQTPAGFSPHRLQQESLARDTEAAAESTPTARIGLPQSEFHAPLVEQTQINPSPCRPSVQQSL